MGSDLPSPKDLFPVSFPVFVDKVMMLPAVKRPECGRVLNRTGDIWAVTAPGEADGDPSVGSAVEAGRTINAKVQRLETARPAGACMKARSSHTTDSQNAACPPQTPASLPAEPTSGQHRLAEPFQLWRRRCSPGSLV